MIDPELLNILACPACDSRPPVKEDAARSALVCTLCGRVYPVENGIPLMLVEEK